MNNPESPPEKVVLPVCEHVELGLAGLTRVALAGTGISGKPVVQAINEAIGGVLGFGTYPGESRFKLGSVLTHPKKMHGVLKRTAEFPRNTRADDKLRKVFGGVPFAQQPGSLEATASRKLAATSLSMEDPAFHDLIHAQAARFVRGLSGAISSPGVDIVPLSEAMTYNVIAYRMLGESADAARGLLPLWNELNDAITKWIMAIFVPAEKLPKKLIAITDEIHALLAEPIRLARQASATSERKDTLSRLVKLSDDDKYVESYLSGLLFAGHITTAAALNWLLYCLDIDPEVKAKVYKEVASIETLPKRLTDFATACPYTYLVICETLRLYPVVPLIGRGTNLTQNEAMGNAILRPGDMVQCFVATANWSPEIWGDDVKRFKPSRFAKENLHEVQREAFMPFGIGVTKCVGELLALNEMLAVLMELAKQHIAVEQAGPVDIDTKPSLVLLPKGNKCVMRAVQYSY